MSIEELYQNFVQSDGVSIDTRTILKNQIFFAISGPNFDGNKFAVQAMEKGALLSVVSDESIAHKKGMVYFQNPMKVLQDLAKIHRRHLTIPIIGITGSNGKTTTKELLHVVLSEQFDACATPGNFNNHLGVPLTLLNAPRASDIMIVEMGSNQKGDIAFLCSIAQPNLGLITNIGLSHIEGLKSLQGVLEEKRALFDFVQSKEGTFFLNSDDHLLNTLQNAEDNIVKYSKGGGNFGYVELLSEHDGLKVKFSVSNESSTHEASTHLSGSYNLENICAALSVGHYFHIDMELMLKAISSYQPSNMRSEVVHTARNNVILDAYNANPTSMKLSIESMLQQRHSKKVLILGDMLELGTESSELHKQIIDAVLQHPFDRVILVGSEMVAAGSDHFDNYIGVEDLLNSNELKEISDALVLVKASRGIRLEKVMNQL